MFEYSIKIDSYTYFMYLMNYDYTLTFRYAILDE